jgi:ABC-type branched-subunit amino acid transport system substrate-binding protein
VTSHPRARGPRLWLVALLGAACALTVGCGSNDEGTSTGGDGSAGAGLQAGDTYKVGYAVSKTGRLTFFEEPFLKGLELAVEQINAAGGIDGKERGASITRPRSATPTGSVA